MLKKTNQRGDTLVEVILAVTILSMIAVAAFAVMNRGVATAYGVMERTETRAKVNEQLELLTYFRDVYVATDIAGGDTAAYPASVWSVIGGSLGGSAPDPASCSPSPSRSFSLQRNSADTRYEVVDYASGSGIASQTTPEAGDGLWIEAVPSSGAAVPFIDFYVKACWKNVTGATPNEIVTSTVRLYDR